MNGRSTLVSVREVRKSFDETQVIDGVSLDIYKGEFLTFFGPNGCGKSTLLNIIAGIETYDSGEIEIDANNQGAKFGYIFQDYRGNLMPWLSVAENIAFPLKVRGVPKAERLGKIHALQEKFDFEVDLDARTFGLSGGQAQLTSILRALVIDPDILIMDEPFSALDYQTNLGLYEKLINIWKTAGVTVLLVSHDIDEALYLGERTVFLSKRPANIRAILNNNLESEKSLEQMASEEFARLKRKALDIFVPETLSGQ